MNRKIYQRYLNRLVLTLVMTGITITALADDMIFSSSFEDTRQLVQGSATGVSSSGLILKMVSGIDSELLQVNTNGVFGFNSLLDINTSWTVEINSMPNNPTPQNCQLSNNSGTMSSAGVNNLLVSCDAAVSKWDEMNWDSASWN